MKTPKYPHRPRQYTFVGVAGPAAITIIIRVPFLGRPRGAALAKGLRGMMRTLGLRGKDIAFIDYLAGGDLRGIEGHPFYGPKEAEEWEKAEAAFSGSGGHYPHDYLYDWVDGAFTKVRDPLE